MLIKYIRDRKIYIIIYLFITTVFSLLTYLYGLKFNGILYALLLTSVALLFVAVIDFYYYDKKHKALDKCVKSLICTALLPTSKNLIESDYQLIISDLDSELQRLVTEYKHKNQDTKDFYALWVHQIKTPISAMSMLIQNDTSEQAKLLSMELFKIERYTELVLNYVRLDDISNDLSFCYVSLKSIVNQVIKKFAPVFIAKSVSVDVENVDTKVLTDEKWLVFAVEQIVSNALKYTQSGGNITVTTENTFTLVIKDNGVGILPEDLPRIFERGFTGYNGRMDKKATGLGLYLTSQTLSKLGNTIDISSDGKNGTTVRIDLSREKLICE